MRNHRSTNGRKWITITECKLLEPCLISLMATKIIIKEGHFTGNTYNKALMFTEKKRYEMKNKKWKRKEFLKQMEEINTA